MTLFQQGIKDYKSGVRLTLGQTHKADWLRGWQWQERISHCGAEAWGAWHQGYNSSSNLKQWSLGGSKCK